MKIQIEGWQCDICGREYFKGDCGVSAKGSVDIQADPMTCQSEKRDDVCDVCIEKINNFICGLKNKETEHVKKEAEAI